MRISEIFNSNRQFISLEVVPPLKSISRAKLLDSIRPLMEFNPPYINVTNHRDEYVFEAQPDGSYLRKLERRRVSQTAVCSSIMDEFKVEVVPHIICAGATKEQLFSELADFSYLGVHNVMALRGDCLVGEKRFTPEPGGYSYASELIGDMKENPSTRNLCIGVGAYPEKHFEAPNLETDGSVRGERPHKDGALQLPAVLRGLRAYAAEISQSHPGGSCFQLDRRQARRMSGQGRTQ